MKLAGLRKCAADFNSRTSFPSTLPYTQNDLLGAAAEQKAAPFRRIEDTTLKNNIRGGAEMGARTGADLAIGVGNGLGWAGTTGYDISNRVMHNKYPQTYSYDPDNTLTKSWTRMTDDLSRRYGVQGFKYPNGQTAQQMWQSGHPDGRWAMTQETQLRKTPTDTFWLLGNMAGLKGKNVIPSAMMLGTLNSYSNQVDAEERYKSSPNGQTNEPPQIQHNTPINATPPDR